MTNDEAIKYMNETQMKQFLSGHSEDFPKWLEAQYQPEHPLYQITIFEKEILTYAYDHLYFYIARDDNDSLHLFKDYPSKSSDGEWSDNPIFTIALKVPSSLLRCVSSSTQDAYLVSSILLQSDILPKIE